MIRHLVLRNLAKQSHHSESATVSKDSEDENDNEAIVSIPFAENGFDTTP